MNFKQELVGLFGKPVSENPTQVMVEAAFEKLQLDWRYLTLEVSPSDLEDAVNGARAIGLKGFNCTIPHKVEVIQYLDGLGESAAVIGAVNCVVNKNGKLIGENTDGKGFLTALKKHTEVDGKNIVLLGAGGAARAIGVELALSGASTLYVVNRSEERGRKLAELLNSKTDSRAEYIKWSGDYYVKDSVDIVVNATSIGLYPNYDERVPVNISSLKPEMIVADVIPNPPVTRFIAEAKEIGCLTIDGLGMLVNQGVLGIEYWTGKTPDSDIMRKALEKVFS